MRLLWPITGVCGSVAVVLPLRQLVGVTASLCAVVPVSPVPVTQSSLAPF